eukprot:gb/GECG01007686.1/.p1 GENE.gb/GECG01007686.1/~~gb/GECG01007686.1/.p1  ORF type:complete len:300 (+),score=41.53 gb/GECG01007686.1/:1-900(+)
MWRRVTQKVADAVNRRTQEMQAMWSEVRHRTHYPEEMMLFEFRTAEDIEQYMTTTDTILGGSSVCNLYLKEYKNFASACFEGIIDFETTEEYCNGGFANFRTRVAGEQKAIFRVFMVLSGRSTADKDRRKKVQTKFPFVKTFERRRFPGVRVFMYNSTTGEKIVLNVTLSSFREMSTQKGKWETLVLPFDELKLVHRGVISDYQVQLQREHLSGMGVLLADHENGPFRFEIQYVKAISPNLFDQDHFDGGKRHNAKEFVRTHSKQITASRKAKENKLISPEERKRRAKANPGEINPFDD